MNHHRFMGLLFGRDNRLAELIGRRSPWFLQLMRNRVELGRYRYGVPGEAPSPGHSVVVPFHKFANWDYSNWEPRSAFVSRSWEKWRRTGNTEFIVDAANYRLLDYTFGAADMAAGEVIYGVELFLANPSRFHPEDR